MYGGTSHSNRFRTICVTLGMMSRGPRALVGLTLSTFIMGSFTVTATASGSPPHRIEVHVILVQHRAVAKQAIAGTVILTNTTASVVTVDTCASDGWLAVGLSGQVNSYPFGQLLVGCSATVRLAPGPNRFPVRVITTYAGCVQPQPAGGSHPTPDFPWCTVAGSPPLPEGRYVTKVNIVGPSGLTQAPNRVALQLKSPKKPPPLVPCAISPVPHYRR